MSRRCRALFPHPRQPTAGARSSQPQCQVLHAKPACGLTVRMAVEPATSAKATAASPRNLFMGVSSLNRLLPRLPLAVQVVCDRQHKKTHLAGTRVPLGVPVSRGVGRGSERWETARGCRCLAVATS